MAFIGVLLVLIGIAAVFGGIFFLGVVPIIVGTILIKKTKYHKIGVTLRIFGYIVIIPLTALAVFTVWWWFLR